MRNDARVSSGKVAICVGGVPGTGKTTLLRAHTGLHIRDMQITGSAIVKAMISPSSVHELDGWTLERRQSVREQSISELRKLLGQCTGRLLVDGHFTLRNRTTGLLERIFTPEDKDFFQALVLLHPPNPELVLAQRKRDERNRSTESIEETAAHIEYELLEGRRLATEMGVPLLELTEPDLTLRLNALAGFLTRVAPLERL